MLYLRKHPDPITILAYFLRDHQANKLFVQVGPKEWPIKQSIRADLITPDVRINQEQIMKKLQPFICTSALVLAMSVSAIAKPGTISTTKAGTISTTKTGTI